MLRKQLLLNINELDNFLWQSWTLNINNCLEFTFWKTLDCWDLLINNMFYGYFHTSENFLGIDYCHCKMYVKRMVIYVHDVMTTRTLDSTWFLIITSLSKRWHKSYILLLLPLIWHFSASLRNPTKIHVGWALKKITLDQLSKIVW